MGFPGGSVVKYMPTMQETQIQSLGQDDPLEKGIAIHSSILAWRIPWKVEPDGYSPWVTRVRTERLSTEQHIYSIMY